MSTCFSCGFWETLTSDPEILQTVSGASIDFDTTPPCRHSTKPLLLKGDDFDMLHSEIHQLIAKGVVVPCCHDTVEYFSPMFPVFNTDESVRMILNLKDLNHFIKYLHFKMDSIHSVLHNVTPNCFMASIDLKSAYYSVPIAKYYQRYLKFSWEGKNYQFVCFPNGLSSCPRKFTKLTKVPLSTLREKDNVLISGYLDDFHLQGFDYLQCERNVLKALLLFDQLGFVIHPDKSVLIPQQEIKYLGFIINSVTMTISLTPEKKVSLRNFISEVLNSPQLTIRTIACLVGKIISSLPASTYGALYYRYLEKDKILALKTKRGNFDAYMTVSKKGREDLMWWFNTLPTMSAPIQLPAISCTISCDASNTGWGAVSPQHSTGGAWLETEQDLHINCKEMLAIYYGLRSFSDFLSNLHIRVLSDNTTAVSVINNMGTVRSEKCNFLAQEIWAFCQSKGIWISCAHIPGSLNSFSDFESRKEYKQAEWMLNPDLFHRATHKLAFNPDLDCFASRLNTQLPCYASFQPDPYAKFVDSFSINWGDFKCYLFPPFSLIGRVLQKIRIDGATVLCVLPHWPTQSWWPLLQHMMIRGPWVIKPSPKNLLLPQKHVEIHPLAKKLKLLICIVSGVSSEIKVWGNKP